MFEDEESENVELLDRPGGAGSAGDDVEDDGEEEGLSGARTTPP